VVVCIWDQRRLGVPITHFLDKPFQNWTKAGSTELLGPVMLQVDFTTDMEALRAELRRILENEGKELWDKRVGSMVIQEVQDRTMQVRVLLSAANADALGDLRALVREKLVYFLRQRPEWLPFTRTESRALVAGQPGDKPASNQPAQA
jgi:hypothetical protein